MNNKKTFFSGVAVGIIFMLLVNAGVMGIKWAANVVTPGFSKTEMSEIDKKVKNISGVLEKYYVDDIDKEQLIEGTYAGLVAGVGDPYTNYFDKKELESFMTETEGSYAGIGVVVSVDPEDQLITVVSPFEGSPGEKAGILPGDKIIKVNGFDVRGDELEEAVSMMKGPEGTSVKITLYRSEEARQLDVDVKRAIIDIPTVSHKMLENKIGYLKISGFDQVTYNQFMQAYEDLQKQGQKGMIIDLRNNPGGLLHIVIPIADQLVPEGLIVYTEDKNGKREVANSDANHIEVPLVLLVNGNSASASEILAGAVKDHNVGKLVGTTTFGKGLVQDLKRLGDGTAVKVTIAKYYTPSGTHIQGIGIEPDYVVELPEELKNKVTLEESEDIQLQKAIEVIEAQQ